MKTNETKYRAGFSLYNSKGTLPGKKFQMTPKLAKLIFIPLGLLFIAAGAQVYVMGATPTKIKCWHEGYNKICEVTRAAFPFKTTTQRLENVTGVELDRAQRVDRRDVNVNQITYRYKLQLVNRDFRKIDLENAGNTGLDERAAAKSELESLVKRGLDFDYSYEVAGAAMLGIVFAVVGLLLVMAAFFVKPPAVESEETTGTNEI